MTTTKTPLVSFSKKIRNAVGKASDGLPSVGEWLTRIEKIGDPFLNAAIEGIWAGRSGEVRIEMPGTRSLLCVGWHEKRVEWSYIS